MNFVLVDKGYPDTSLTFYAFCFLYQYTNFVLPSIKFMVCVYIIEKFFQYALLSCHVHAQCGCASPTIAAGS